MKDFKNGPHQNNPPQKEFKLLAQGSIAGNSATGAGVHLILPCDHFGSE